MGVWMPPSGEVSTDPSEGGDGDARIGLHTRGGDLGEDMGTGGEEDQECQEEGEEKFFHRGLPFLIMKKSTRVGWIHMLAEGVGRKTNFLGSFTSHTSASTSRGQAL